MSKLLACTAVFAVCGCKTAQKRSETSDNDIPWSEIVTMRSIFMTTPKAEKIATLEPSPIIEKKISSLNDLASMIELQKARPYQQGIYGKRGNAVVFITTKEVTPDFDRLYWIMVRVLSEKYGCFIKEKESYMKMTRFRCRDSRTVVMQKHSTDHFMLFYAKQFDRWGREIFM